MKKRDFNAWLGEFRPSIADYKYYIDFDKVKKNVDDIKVELHILNSLIGSVNIEVEFERILTNYPKTIRCIPILLAVRGSEIDATDINGFKLYNFSNVTMSIDEYSYFMRETGLFSLLESHLINNLYDYATGVEVGLNTNARKNRGGTLMEDLVESYIRKLNIDYEKEKNASEIEAQWGINLSTLLNSGRSEKRFDFAINFNGHIYLIETNFYKSSGSKLNETARSYKNIAQSTNLIENVTFVWITDGLGWINAKKNLLETFEFMDNIYNLNELENDILEELIKGPR